MITKEELFKIKEIRKTNAYYEEKEYLQYIFLNAISRYPDNFVFKGGTCLRICYGLERASEDLDFTTNLSVDELKKIINKCLKDFEFLNIEYNIYAVKECEGNIRFEIRLKGPLFTGNLSSSNTLKIDFNKRKVKNKVVKVIQKLFFDVPLFSIVVLDEKEILAEKIRALINRADPKDFYDIWVLFNKDLKLDKKLLYEKLKEEKSDLSKLEFPSKEKYEVSLKNLLRNLPPYEQLIKEVKKRLKTYKKTNH